MTDVIINDILPRTQAIAIAGQTVYTTNPPWTANVASDVVVYSRPANTPADDFTQLLSPSQYNVAFIGSANTVQVTLLTPSNAGDVVTIIRQTPADYLNLYTNTNFTPSMLNNDFGILTLVDQQEQMITQQVTPHYNYSELLNQPNNMGGQDIILPILGANQIWAKDPTDNFIIAVDLNEIISGGTVTQINTGTGLTGGPITDAGTISFAPIAANSFWANTTGGAAVPTVTSLSTFLTSASIGVTVQAYSAALSSIAGLTTSANELIYTTATNTYATLGPANNSVLITGNTGVPSLSQTLPQAVQTNIQYLGVQNQNLNMGTFQINNVENPTHPQDAATKAYVDMTALSGTSVYAASTGSLGTVTQSGSGVGATLTNAGAQATFSLDSVNPPVGSNVLIKNTATGMTAANEGIYTVTNAGSNSTNWILTRAASYSTPSQINNTGLIIVLNGSSLSGTAWYNTNNVTTVDTTPLNYAEFGNISLPLSLAQGGTNANLTANAGAILYSTSTAFALSGVGLTGQIFQSAGTSAPTWSTATYPSTTTINQILYSSSNNVVAGLATANNGVLFTSSGGVPSIGTAPIVAGGTGVTSVTIAPTATAFSGWDANSNLSANNFLANYATRATAAGTTTLTVASPYQQYFTGTTTQTLIMPVTSTLVLGQSWYIVNNSSGIVTVESSGGNTIQAMAGGTTLLVTCVLTTGTTAASWNGIYAFDGGEGSGTVNSGTANQLAYYATSGTAVSGLASANSGVLVTSSAGVPSILAAGTTGQVLQASTSGTPAWSTATYPSTGGTGGTILRSTGTNFANSTFTINNTFSVNNLVYASASNALAGLATANSSGLLTNGSGVPAWVTVTGTGAPVLGTSPTIATPYINTINDSNGNTMVQFSTAATAVNYIQIQNSATGVVPTIAANGSDTNIILGLKGQGTGGVEVQGSTAASNAQTGFVGEVFSSSILAASAITLTGTGNLTSITLSAGDWDVTGNVTVTTSTTLTKLTAGISTTTNTQPDVSLQSTIAGTSTGIGGVVAPTQRINVSGSQTVYIVATTAGTGTIQICGNIFARRRR